MNPDDYAKNLMVKFKNVSRYMSEHEAKACALITVKEMEQIPTNENKKYFISKVKTILEK